MTGAEATKLGTPGASPERPTITGADWQTTRARLQACGAVSFQADRLGDGSWRFSCQLPTAQAGRTHRIEAQAATEAEAVRLALQRAEQWRNARP
jgi:hypothetical protein